MRNIQKDFTERYNFIECFIALDEEKHIRLAYDCLDEIEEYLLKRPIEGFKIDTIKEKWGGLRIYYNTFSNDKIDEIIRKYERKSYING